MIFSFIVFPHSKEGKETLISLTTYITYLQVIQMDAWSKMESNLNRILGAGLVELGALPKPVFKGGPSREEVAAEAARAEKIRQWSKAWRRPK